MATERRHLFFEGRVQGVGFRLTARRLAQSRPVAGWVRNLPDGRVELLAEGEPGALDGFQDAITRVFADHLHGVVATAEPLSDPPLEGFIIG